MSAEVGNDVIAMPAGDRIQDIVRMKGRHEAAAPGGVRALSPGHQVRHFGVDESERVNVGQLPLGQLFVFVVAAGVDAVHESCPHEPVRIDPDLDPVLAPGFIQLAIDAFQIGDEGHEEAGDVLEGAQAQIQHNEGILTSRESNENGIRACPCLIEHALCFG